MLKPLTKFTMTNKQNVIRTIDDLVLKNLSGAGAAEGTLYVLINIFTIGRFAMVDAIIGNGGAKTAFSAQRS